MPRRAQGFRSPCGRKAPAAFEFPLAHAITEGVRGGGARAFQGRLLFGDLRVLLHAARYRFPDIRRDGLPCRCCRRLNLRLISLGDVQTQRLIMGITVFSVGSLFGIGYRHVFHLLEFTYIIPDDCNIYKFCRVQKISKNSKMRWQVERTVV